MLPDAHAVVISVSDCHAVVCRHRQLPDGSVTWECALNADELEADAIAALVAHGGPFMLGEHVPCPSELAERARWS